MVSLFIVRPSGANDAIEVLAAAAPGTINHANQPGVTPLCAAANEGHESAVRLLTRRLGWRTSRRSSLGCSAVWGEGVTAVLLGIGLEAMGGVETVRDAMLRAMKQDHPRILDMVIGIEGEEMRVQSTNSNIDERTPILMFAAIGVYIAATSVLLVAGADERVFEEIEGWCGSEVVGGEA